jgi:hypothetical protein
MALWEMSEEESKEREAKVREYRLFSRDPKKRIMGILMDLHVGGIGMWEEHAEKKADQILNEFTAFTLP